MIGKSGQNGLFRSRFSILGQAPSTPSMLYWRIEEVEKWLAVRHTSVRLAGLIQASATTQMAVYQLTIPVNTMLTKYYIPRPVQIVGISVNLRVQPSVVIA